MIDDAGKPLYRRPPSGAGPYEAWASPSQWVAHCTAKDTTSSLKATQPGRSLWGWLTVTMVWVGLTRPSMNPIWIPSASDIGIPRWRAVPSTTEATPRRRAASSMRLRVPSWSSGPQRPQLETRSAISVKERGIEGGTGTGTHQL